MRLVTLSTIAAISMATAQAAEDLPYYDIDAICARHSKASQKLYCLKREQEAYHELKVRWGKIPDSAKAACDDRSEYRMLRQCLRKEIKALIELEKFQFKR